MEGKHVTSAVIGTVLKITIAAVVIIVIYNAAVAAYDYGYRIFAESPMAEEPGEERKIEIPKDSSAAQIGRILEANGLIADSKLFVLQEFLSEHKGKTNPGVYELNTSMTAEEMLAVIAAEPETTESETTEAGTQE